MFPALPAYPDLDARRHTDVHNPGGGFSSSAARRLRDFVIVRDFKEVCVSGIDKAPLSFYNSCVVGVIVSGTVSESGARRRKSMLPAGSRSHPPYRIIIFWKEIYP